jgi:hypothetical protein
MTENGLSKIIFNLGMKVHKVLGPGFRDTFFAFFA